MGNTSSSRFDEQTDDDAWWPNSGQSDPNPVEPEADASEPSQREFRNENDFQLEMERIREKRKNIIGRKRKEMEDLREEVAKLKLENEQLRKNSLPVGTEDKEIELLRRQNEDLRDILEEKSRLLRESETLVGKNRELRISIAEMQEQLQHLNTEVLNFEQEREDYRAHVIALKDVISVSKHMLKIRESQLKELKEKVDSIEKTLSDRETQVLSQELRNEYERQLANIRNLRTLYEERQRMERREKAELRSAMEDVKKELEEEQKKNGELETRILELETENSTKYDTIKTLESNLGLSKAESRQFKSELSVINQLFSEILLGFNSSQVIDLDQLQKHLEDHHDLLQDIVVNEISSEVSYALPKVLLDLLNQVNGEKTKPGHLETIQEEQDSASSIHQQMNSAEEIVENLPKVWRVLIELLSHQTAPTNTLSIAEDKENPCYKTVDTPKGPSPVLSVSRTFIRLKDLILEKKSLEKETNHLKQLNGHLENRLQDQEKRLELVHSELSKTWLVVGTLQKQHQMLHTQEKILRYELAQKRKLLNELKEELEESREKWAQARAKNSNTEQQWKLLRTEFASRKSTVLSEEYNNSGESGYSDDREGLSSDEEPGYETDISECPQKLTEEKSDLDKLHEQIEDGASLIESSEAEDSEMQASTSKERTLESPKEDLNGGTESAQEITTDQKSGSQEESSILQFSKESENDCLRPTTSTGASEITNETNGNSSKDTQKSLDILKFSCLRDNNHDNTSENDSNYAQKITDENKEANGKSTTETSYEGAEVNSEQVKSLQEYETNACAEELTSDGYDMPVKNNKPVSFERDENNECAQKITSDCERLALNQESTSFEKDESNECSQKITRDCNDMSVKNHECIGLENDQSCSSKDLKTKEEETNMVEYSRITPECAQEITADQKSGSQKESSTLQFSKESETDWLRPTTSTGASEITHENYGKSSKDTQKSLKISKFSNFHDNNQDNTSENDSNCAQKIIQENKDGKSTTETSYAGAEVNSEQVKSIQEDESNACAEELTSDGYHRPIQDNNPESFERDGNNECAQKITSDCERLALNQESTSFEKDESNECSQKITSDCNDMSVKNHECIGLKNDQSCSSKDLNKTKEEETNMVEYSRITPECAQEAFEDYFLHKGDNNGTAQKITSVEREQENYESASSEKVMSGIKTNEKVVQSSTASECIQGPSKEAISLQRDCSQEYSQKISSARKEKNNESVGLETSVDRNSCSPEDPKTEETTATVEAESTSAIQGEQKLTLEEVLARRDERLRRMEGQASQLVNKVANTAIRGVAISNRLDDLHEVYGQSVESSGENIDINDDDSIQNENSQDNEGVD